MSINSIIERLTRKGEDFTHLTWVGDGYSKADLLRDLRELQSPPMTMVIELGAERLDECPGTVHLR